MLVHIEDSLITGGHVVNVAKQIAVAIAHAQYDGGDKLLEVKARWEEGTPSQVGIYVEYHGDLPRYAFVTADGKLDVGGGDVSPVAGPHDGCGEFADDRDLEPRPARNSVPSAYDRAHGLGW